MKKNGISDEDKEQDVGLLSEKKEQKVQNAKSSMALLEDALTLCKFGKFHIRLLITTMCATCATTMVTTTSAYILPSAECDLGMTNVQKGILNAVPFVGQVGAAMFTGFCIDAFGRKFFLVGGNLGILLCCLFEGLSQNYWMLLFGKLVEGIFLSFSTSGTSTMVSEMCPKHLRDRMLLTVASFMSISLMVTALMSWAVLPQPWDFVFSSYFELHSWNIYLIVCSVWSLIACVMYYNLPESPKWLLSHGQEDAALEVIKKIYAENTGEAPDYFPYETLKIPGAAPTISSKDISLKKQILNGLKDSKEIFKRPLVWFLLLFSAITFVCLFAYSALRLWYPQLSTMIEAYIENHHGTADFCTMISKYNEDVSLVTPMLPNVTTVESLLVKNMTEPEICIPVSVDNDTNEMNSTKENHAEKVNLCDKDLFIQTEDLRPREHLSGTQTYINNILMGAISLVCFLISMYLVNHIGNRILIFVNFILCAICSGSLYWTNSSLQIALLVSLACAFVQNALMLQQVIVVDVFPTTLRSLAVSMVLMSGRIGSLVGNIVFPVLLEAGCMAPFLLLTVITLAIASIVYFLPGKKNEGEGGKN